MSTWSLPPDELPATRTRPRTSFAAATTSCSELNGLSGVVILSGSDRAGTAIGVTGSMTEGAPCTVGVANTGEAKVSGVFSSPGRPRTWCSGV